MKWSRNEVVSKTQFSEFMQTQQAEKLHLLLLLYWDLLHTHSKIEIKNLNIAWRVIGRVMKQKTL